MSAPPERLIFAVSAHPELYDVTCPFYSIRTKKERAWMSISQNVGMPMERCKSKWKNLRDTYTRERKKVSRCGAAARTAKRWKYLGILSFLDPFIVPRDASGSTEQEVEEDWASKSRESDEEGETAGPSQTGLTQIVLEDASKKRVREDEDSRNREIQDLLLETLRALQDQSACSPAPTPPRSEDQLFLDSIAPSLERLDPQVKARVKFEIHKIIYEASTVVRNLEPAE
uniref:MADF domain-containing protein n=1 Tax=Salarias fasciatus TaxID=181472 RepID=A0A672F4F0_SALFA